MLSSRKLRANPAVPTDWIRGAAQALADALSGGRVPRPARRIARRLLARAFDAIEQGQGDAALLRRLEGIIEAPLLGPPTPRLLRAVDRRTRGPAPRWDWKVGVQLTWPGRTALIARLDAHAGLHAGITGRIDAVLATFRTRPPDHAARVRTHRLADASERETHTLTEG